MKYLIARLREPSTHNALAVLCTAAAQFFPAYAPVLLGIAAVIAGKTAATPDIRE